MLNKKLKPRKLTEIISQDIRLFSQENLVCEIDKKIYMRSWVLGPGSQVPGPGFWVPGPGSRVPGPGSWVPGIKSLGSRVPLKEYA